MKKTKVACFALCALLLVSSGVMMAGCNNNETVTPTPDGDDNEVVKVTEVTLTLSKTNAKVGDTVTANTTVRPSNATDKSVTLSSSDATIAKIEDGKIVCLKAGKVTITARSVQVTTKKGTAELNVLGTDAEGRAENVFEAEKGNLIDDSSDGQAAMKAETGDDRISGGSLVGSIKKNDRIIWGINASAAETNVNLHFTMMGPSGWGGNWGQISYNFSDFFTIKVNGKNVDTSSINIEGSKELSGSADYNNVSDVEIGDIALKEGLNVVTFVLSNRYDVSSYTDSYFNGNISTFCNLDKMTIWSKADLTYVANTAEVEGADPDVNYVNNKLEVEAATTRVYESATAPDVDMTGKTMVEFKEGMNVMFGLTTTAETTKAKITLKVAAPYVDATTKMEDVALSKILTMNIGGKTVSNANLTIKGNDATGSKENYTEVVTGWINLPKGSNVFSVVVNSGITGYSYLGGLDSITVSTISETVTAYKVDTPIVKQKFKFEAEADTTKRVGYPELTAGATSVEMVAPTKVETDKYNNKLDTSKIIYGIESTGAAYATLTMKYAAPYANTSDLYGDVTIRSVGDLWVNGTIVPTPNTLKSVTAGSKENWNIITLETQIELKDGKNRIAWEPQNYTSDNLTFLGALDYIELETTNELAAYEVNMWGDRNTYFDTLGNEPIYVTCDSAKDSRSWIGVYHADDRVDNSEHAGSLYYYYPQGDKLGTAVNIKNEVPNNKRHLIDGLSKEHGFGDGDGYGSFKVCYFANGDYEATDTFYFSAWTDIDVGYDGVAE